MGKKDDSKNGTQVNEGRRRFLKGCGLTLLTAASYQAISIMAPDRNARAGGGGCGVGCVDLCVSSCTTTQTCVGDTIPDPPPPTCVQGFKGE